MTTDMKCPHCDDMVATMPMSDGRRLGLCGHAWRDDAPMPGIPREEIAQLVRDAVAKERAEIVAMLLGWAQGEGMVSAGCYEIAADAIRARGAT